MPELPEVEVVKRSIKSFLGNLIIKDIKIKEANLRYKVKKQDFNRLIGLRIETIKRRSKYLLFYFEKNIVMICHLGMTGKFFFIDNKERISKTSFYFNIEKINARHNHIIFNFRDKSRLIYNDVRKFGFIKFDSKKNIKKNLHLKFLGPEPLEDKFNFKYFNNYIIGRNRNIKDLLMDQKFVSGLGNIYVNEVLFMSNVKPTKKVYKLLKKDIEKILFSVKKILLKAIKLGGSSIRDFSSSSGKSGSFQEHFNVYGKQGDLCSNSDCKSKIKKIIISNRASFFCPSCQK